MSESRSDRDRLKAETLFDFFTERLRQAQQASGVELSDPTATYLAQLLVRLGRSEFLQREDLPDTLAELHLLATRAHRSQALRLYRHLGDYALTIAGYFEESLARSPVGVRYYAEMGGAAYYRVVDLSGGRASAEVDPWLAAFCELALRFEDCLRVVSDVADRDRAEGTRDLVRLYDRWLRTGSEHAARRLAELGVLPTAPGQEAS